MNANDLAWLALACAIAAPLSVVFIAAISRANRLEDDPDTIIIPPAKEPDGTVYRGEMVDIAECPRRFADIKEIP